MAKADQARLVAGWETLVGYDEEFNLSYEHAVAEEIEAVAADHYVIRLKEGIEFHNGKTVTADDVIYSFQRRLDPDLALAPALQALLDPTGVTKVDDRTVDVQLKQGTVTFLNGLAEYTATVVPVGYTRRTPSRWEPDRTCSRASPPEPRACTRRTPTTGTPGSPISTRCRSSTSPTPPPSSTR